MPQNLDIEKLIQQIEEMDDLEEKEDMKQIFVDRLQSLPRTNYHERGVCFYYILRILLKTHQHYETDEVKKYFQKMVHCFRSQQKVYIRKIRSFKKLSHVAQAKIRTFYRLMERYFASLEVLYDKKDFVDALRNAYEEKMYYRKYFFLFQGKRWRYFEYAFLDVTCKYGDSFFRWGLTSFMFAVSISVVYFLLDLGTPSGLKIIANGHWYDYIYFSLVTVTSLGYGDFVPITPFAKFFAALEVFFGFIMLGVFVNLIQKKL